LQANLNGKKIIACKPSTYMNLSGEAVAKVKSYFNIENSRIIVVCDDVNLPVGSSRLRAAGTDGGHNGLKSVIASIGEDFWRFRIGVGTNDIALEDYVLQKPSEDDNKKIDQIIDEQLQIVLESLSKDELENKTYQLK
jgi:PTH1 family peptidyl-tRNA hydrolase